ncbi:hypothetical protein BT69DRAFT_193445 [Atractiella rhizophila]|nr:hypothetical protein BT69DRAFT_193445 [Atractiella rhizophila]
MEEQDSLSYNLGSSQVSQILPGKTTPTITSTPRRKRSPFPTIDIDLHSSLKDSDLSTSPEPSVRPKKATSEALLRIRNLASQLASADPPASTSSSTLVNHTDNDEFSAFKASVKRRPSILKGRRTLGLGLDRLVEEEDTTKLQSAQVVGRFPGRVSLSLSHAKEMGTRDASELEATRENTRTPITPPPSRNAAPPKTPHPPGAFPQTPAGASIRTRPFTPPPLEESVASSGSRTPTSSQKVRSLFQNHIYSSTPRAESNSFYEKEKSKAKEPPTPKVIEFDQHPSHSRISSHSQAHSGYPISTANSNYARRFPTAQSESSSSSSESSYERPQPLRSSMSKRQVQKSRAFASNPLSMSTSIAKGVRFAVSPSHSMSTSPENVPPRSDREEEVAGTSTHFVRKKDSSREEEHSVSPLRQRSKSSEISFQVKEGDDGRSYPPRSSTPKQKARGRFASIREGITPRLRLDDALSTSWKYKSVAGEALGEGDEKDKGKLKERVRHLREEIGGLEEERDVILNELKRCEFGEKGLMGRIELLSDAVKGTDFTLEALKRGSRKWTIMLTSLVIFEVLIILLMYLSADARTSYFFQTVYFDPFFPALFLPPGYDQFAVLPDTINLFSPRKEGVLRMVFHWLLSKLPREDMTTGDFELQWPS